MEEKEFKTLEQIEKKLGSPDSLGNLTAHGICRLIDMLIASYGKINI